MLLKSGGIQVRVTHSLVEETGRGVAGRWWVSPDPILVILPCTWQEDSRLGISIPTPHSTSEFWPIPIEAIDRTVTAYEDLP